MNLWRAMERYKKVMAGALVLCLGLGCYVPAQASKVSDNTESKEDVLEKKENAEDKKNEAQEGLDNINQQMEAIQEEQNGLYEEMASYDEELMILLTDKDILEQDIAQKEEDIRQTENDLAEAKEQERNQYEAMKVRIQYMYENGDQSYWVALLGSKSITELLNRAEYASEVYNYDRKLLEDYQETVATVEELKEQYAGELDEMEELELSMEEQQAQLEDVIAKLQTQVADFDTKLANAQALAAQYADTIWKQNQIIKAQDTKLAQIAEAERLAAEEEARRKAAEEEARRKAAEEEERRRQQENSESEATEDTGSTEDSESTENGSTENSEATESTESGNGSGSSSGGSSGGSGSGGSSSGGSSGGGGKDPAYTTNVSGSDVVNYACKFVGNPYVLGGNSLTEGTDCSGFINLVFAHFGIVVPRTSYELRSAGNEVSYENAKPGDIICYAGHVALYIGNGQIVHASTPSSGIKYGTATYRTILSVRRVL